MLCLLPFRCCYRLCWEIERKSMRNFKTQTIRTWIWDIITLVKWCQIVTFAQENIWFFKRRIRHSFNFGNYNTSHSQQNLQKQITKKRKTFRKAQQIISSAHNSRFRNAWCRVMGAQAHARLGFSARGSIPTPSQCVMPSHGCTGPRSCFFIFVDRFLL